MGIGSGTVRTRTRSRHRSFGILSTPGDAQVLEAAHPLLCRPAPGRRPLVT